MYRGMGDTDLMNVVLPTLDYGRAQVDPAGNVIVPYSDNSGWVSETPGGFTNQGAGPQPLGIPLSAGVLPASLPQSSTGSFQQVAAAASGGSGLSNNTLLIGGAVVFGVLFLGAVSGGRRR